MPPRADPQPGKSRSSKRWATAGGSWGDRGRETARRLFGGGGGRMRAAAVEEAGSGSGGGGVGNREWWC